MATDTVGWSMGGASPLSAREVLTEGITIERWMFERLGLKGTAAIVYAAIWRSGEGGLTASLPKIGYIAGVSSKAAKRTLRSLVDAGLILEPESPSNPCGARTWRAATPPVPLDIFREKGLGS